MFVIKAAFLCISWSDKNVISFSCGVVVYATMLLALLILTSFHNVFMEEVYYKETPLQEEYDFIIVGSGSSGAVLANRLSEIPHWTVLLLEAGDVPTSFTDIPGIAATFQMSKYDWNYTTEKEEGVCLGLYNPNCFSVKKSLHFKEWWINIALGLEVKH